MTTKPASLADVRKRRFRDAHPDARCKATIRLRDGSEAQCGRARVVGDLCRQHSKLIEEARQ